MNINPPPLPDGNDPLDALLRESEPYIPDDGFTARVLNQLPARRKRRWLRFAVLSAAVLIGVGLAAWQAPALFAVFDGALQPATLLHRQALFGFVALFAALGSLVWVGFKLANEED